jgi:hypothetical protein
MITGDSKMVGSAGLSSSGLGINSGARSAGGLKQMMVVSRFWDGGRNCGGGG